MYVELCLACVVHCRGGGALGRGPPVELRLRVQHLLPHVLSVGLDDVGAPYISFTASGWLDPLGICIRTTGLVPQLEASVGVWTQCFFRMRLLFGSKVMICFSGGA